MKNLIKLSAARELGRDMGHVGRCVLMVAWALDGVVDCKEALCMK